MKRIALLLVLSATACSTMHKGGARGPNIQRTEQPADQKQAQPEVGALDGRADLGQL